MADLRRTDCVESFEELCLTICWSEEEDPADELARGVYEVCGGEWRREDDNQWRFWEDPVVADEMNR